MVMGSLTCIFSAHIVTQKSFDSWVHKMQDKNNPLTLQGYKKLYDPDMDMPAQYYSQVPKGLFMKIMMQYMESKNWLHEKV